MKKLLMALGILFFLPLSVNATTGTVTISCNSINITEQESTTCTLYGGGDSGISGVSINITTSVNITINNLSKLNDWQGTPEANSIDLYTDNNKFGTFAIATFTLTAVNEGIGTINVSGNFSDENFELLNVNGSQSITVVKKTNLSENLPAQNPSVQQGKPETSVKPNSPNINNSLAVKSNDATLSKLEVENILIEFDKNIYEYSFEVDNGVDSLNIIAETSSKKAIAEIPNNVLLEYGENIIEIKITAEDGTEQIYTLKVTRLEREKSSNSLLKELKIDGYNITFNKNTFVYNLGDIKENKLSIHYNVEEQNAKVKIYGNKNLGENDQIVIEVTAENGNITNYILNINNVSHQINWPMIMTGLFLFVSIGINMFFIIKKQKCKSLMV